MTPENSYRAVEYLYKHQQDFLSQLEAFVRIPSISTDPGHAGDMEKAAEWLVSQFNELGCQDIRNMSTPGHPVIYAEAKSRRPGKPTILIYGHYDVQPAEDLSDWVTPPFSPHIRGDNFFGRGVSDMKGQIMAVLAAVKSILAHDVLPVNLKFIIEGEEEIGSPSLEKFLKENRETLYSDLILNLDVGFLDKDLPTISYGLRGIASFELHISGPKTDLHSGVFGGIIHNPALVMADVLSGTFDENGKITLPNFYDRVLDLGDDERSKLGQLPMNERYYLEQTGAPELWGETEFSPTERIAARPTLEINGLTSGYTGQGEKTIIPSNSSVKITTRLVPEQEPDEVHEQLLAYLEGCVPPSVEWDLHYHGGIKAYLADFSSVEIRTFAEALEKAYRKKAVYFRDGGSIPAAILMKETLGLNSILSGFGLPSDNIHAPNENIHIPTWLKGIESLVYFFTDIST